jgi:hypothetical protein
MNKQETTKELEDFVSFNLADIKNLYSESKELGDSFINVLNAISKQYGNNENYSNVFEKEVKKEEEVKKIVVEESKIQLPPAIITEFKIGDIVEIIDIVERQSYSTIPFKELGFENKLKNANGRNYDLGKIFNVGIYEKVPVYAIRLADGKELLISGKGIKRVQTIAKLGDIVELTSPGKIYPSEENLFKEFNFKDKNYNDYNKTGACGKVFGIGFDGVGNIIYAVSLDVFDDVKIKYYTQEIIVGENGIKKIPNDFDINDIVSIDNIGKNHSQFQIMFEKLGFKNTNKNEFIASESADKFIVFNKAFHGKTNKILYAIRNPKGSEYLFSQGGLKLVEKGDQYDYTSLYPKTEEGQEKGEEKIQIGSLVRIKDIGEKFEAYSEKFKELGFKNKKSNENGENDDLAVVFGISVSQLGKEILALRIVDNGKELLIGKEVGVEKVKTKFDVGDKLKVVKIGAVFSTFKRLFEVLGFKDNIENDINSNTDIVTVFGITKDKNNVIYGVSDQYGQYLIGEEGLELVQKSGSEKKKELKVGDKVKLPLTKSAGAGYDSTNAIKEAKKLNLPYLYLIKITGDIAYLWYDSVGNTGDKFSLSKDNIELYEEETKPVIDPKKNIVKTVQSTSTNSPQTNPPGITLTPNTGNRQSPTASANDVKAGVRVIGNNGKWWEAKLTAGGYNQWKQMNPQPVIAQQQEDDYSKMTQDKLREKKQELLEVLQNFEEDEPEYQEAKVELDEINLYIH